MTQMTHTNRTIFNCQLASVLLMAAGFGWIDGNFVQPVATSWGAIADILHFVHTFEDTMPVIVLNLGTLLWFAILLFGWRGAQATATAPAAQVEVGKK